MTEAQLAAVVFDTARGQALEELTLLVGRVQACSALGVSRATYYRHHRQSPAPQRPRPERRRHPRALSPEEETRVLDVLHSPEFADMAPAGIYPHAPYDVHFGLAGQLREMRADVLEAVYAKHPERFVRKPPEPPKLPAAAWINKPAPAGPLIPAQR